jgi:hypothetical protein
MRWIGRAGHTQRGDAGAHTTGLRPSMAIIMAIAEMILHE